MAYGSLDSSISIVTRLHASISGRARDFSHLQSAHLYSCPIGTGIRRPVGGGGKADPSLSFNAEVRMQTTMDFFSRCIFMRGCLTKHKMPVVEK
jgi:hypothetical protein